jgi:hypothetical protein
MKTHEQRTQKHRHRRFEADLEAAASTIFRRCPTLCGFAVRDSAYFAGGRSAPQHVSGLFVTEISIYPQRDLEVPVEIRSEIVSTLSALIDDCPEAGALLRERTFARAFH